MYITHTLPIVYIAKAMLREAHVFGLAIVMIMFPLFYFTGAPECQNVWWGQSYVIRFNLPLPQMPKNGRDQSPHVPIRSDGPADLACVDKCNC